MQPSVPLILRVGSACVLDFELGLDDIGFPTTEERFPVVLALWMPVVVGTHQAFQPLPVWPVVRKTYRWKPEKDRRS